MKQKYWMYVLAFLFGVVLVNLIGDASWAGNSMLNRHNLMTLTFDGIIFERYLVQILFLRLRTIIILWILTLFLPKRIISMGFALLICSMLGGILAVCILENGLWGVLLWGVALFPHGICYGMAFVLWNKINMEYSAVKNRTEVYFVGVLILAVVGIGCVIETYIGPNLIKNIVKY